MVLKVGNMGRMAPRLQPNLPAQRLGKTIEPSRSRKGGNDIFSRFSMNHAFHVPQVRVLADIVINGRQLDELSQKGNAAKCAKILMPDNGLARRIGLVLVGAKLLQDVHGLKSAVEFKRHARGGCVVVRGANVVEERRDGQRG